MAAWCTAGASLLSRKRANCRRKQGGCRRVALGRCLSSPGAVHALGVYTTCISSSRGQTGCRSLALHFRQPFTEGVAYMESTAFNPAECQAWTQPGTASCGCEGSPAGTCLMSCVSRSMISVCRKYITEPSSSIAARVQEAHTLGQGLRHIEGCPGAQGGPA